MGITRHVLFSTLIFQMFSALAFQTTIEKSFAGIQKRGDSLMRLGKFQKAAEDFNTVYQHGLQQNDSTLLALACNGLGSVRLYKKELDSAVHFYFKGLSYLPTGTRGMERIKILNNLAIVHSHLKQYEKAKQFFEEALPEAEGNLLLSILSNSYGVYVNLNEDQKAEACLNKAIQLSDELQNPYVKSVLYTNQCDFYLRQKRWDKALKSGLEGLAIKEEIQSKEHTIVFNNIGYAYHQLGKFEKARVYYQRALEGASLQEKEQLYKNLRNLFADIGNNKEALVYFEKYDAVKDSIKAEDFNGKIAELEEKYRSAQKQLEIESLEVENKLQKTVIRQQKYLGAFVLVLLCLMAGIVYVWLKQKNAGQELQRASLQQKLLLTQLSPHFIFNALQSVQSFLFLNKVESSMEYLHSFGKLIRGVLESSDKEYISLDQEIDILENYLLLQQAGTKSGFQYKIRTENIPEEALPDIELPGMLIQPFVENAVMHGITNKEGGMILVKFELMTNDVLAVTIADNGSGIFPDQRTGKNGMYTSMGMDIIRKRIQTFNKTHKEKLLLKIDNHSDDSLYPGARVSIKIPLLN